MLSFKQLGIDIQSISLNKYVIYVSSTYLCGVTMGPFPLVHIALPGLDAFA